MTLAPADSTEFVARYLQNPEANELLCAAAARHPDALAALLAFVKNPRMPVDIRRTSSSLWPPPAPGGWRVPGVVIANESEEEAAVEAAITALGASRFREEYRSRIAERLEARKSSRLTAAFVESFAQT